MEMSLTKLPAALVVAQRTAQAVAKDSTNSFHKYKYASAEALIEEARSALSSSGLALFTLRTEVQPSVFGETQSTLLVTYRLYHESGEYLDSTSTTEVVPEKGRPQDKAEAAAKTLDLGYFLRNLLLLPREDANTAVDQRNDTSHVPKKAEPSAASIEAARLILLEIEVARAAGDLALLQAAGKRAREAGVVDSVKEAYVAADSDIKRSKAAGK